MADKTLKAEGDSSCLRFLSEIEKALMEPTIQGGIGRPITRIR